MLDITVAMHYHSIYANQLWLRFGLMVYSSMNYWVHNPCINSFRSVTYSVIIGWCSQNIAGYWKSTVPLCRWVYSPISLTTLAFSACSICTGLSNSLLESFGIYVSFQTTFNLLYMQLPFGAKYLQPTYCRECYLRSILADKCQYSSFNERVSPPKSLSQLMKLTSLMFCIHHCK